MAEQEQAGPVEETWVFIGARVSAAGKRVAAWLLPGGHVLTYLEKTSGYVTGGEYTVMVERRPVGGDEDRIGTFKSKPAWTGRRRDYDEVAPWRAAEASAEARLALLARERATAKQDILDEALAPLIDYARGLRTGIERDAFLAYLIRKITAGAWTPPRQKGTRQ